MYVCDVSGVHIVDFPSHQSFYDALPQDLVEDLLHDIVVPEPPTTIWADGRCIRRFLCQLQSAESLVSHVVIDLFFQPRLIPDLFCSHTITVCIDYR